MNLVHVSRIVIASALLVGVAHASAGSAKTALLVSGTASTHARELATTTIEAVARDAGLPVAKPVFTAKEAATITGCVTAPQAWSCIASVIRDRGLQQVAVVSLATDTGPDSSPMVVVTEQIIVANLDTAIAGQRFCVRCTDDVLVNVTTELTRSLFQEVEVRSGRTVVAISSTPRGARITFDGNSMGATDRSFNTFPGTHTVVLELDGYRRELRSMDAALDKTAELSVTMRPIAGSADETRRGAGDPQTTVTTPSAPLAPKLLIGVGALAVVAGVVVLVFNQNPTTKPAGTEQPRYYRDTVTPGVGLVVGGVAVGVGGYLWWRYTRSTVAPAVAPTTGGATVGITKAF